jgi:hypothetical protein
VRLTSRIEPQPERVEHIRESAGRSRRTQRRWWDGHTSIEKVSAVVEGREGCLLVVADVVVGVVGSQE